MSFNIQSLLSRSAEVAAAGRTLGLSEDEIFAALRRISNNPEAARIAESEWNKQQKVLDSPGSRTPEQVEVKASRIEKTAAEKVAALAIESMMTSAQRSQPRDAEISVPKQFKNVTPPNGRAIIRDAKQLARDNGQNYEILSTEDQTNYVTQAMRRAVGAEEDLRVKSQQDPKRYFKDNDENRAMLMRQKNVLVKLMC